MASTFPFTPAMLERTSGGEAPKKCYSNHYTHQIQHHHLSETAAAKGALAAAFWGLGGIEAPSNVTMAQQMTTMTATTSPGAAAAARCSKPPASSESCGARALLTPGEPASIQLRDCPSIFGLADATGSSPASDAWMAPPPGLTDLSSSLAESIANLNPFLTAALLAATLPAAALAETLKHSGDVSPQAFDAECDGASCPSSFSTASTLSPTTGLETPPEQPDPLSPKDLLPPAAASDVPERKKTFKSKKKPQDAVADSAAAALAAAAAEEDRLAEELVASGGSGGGSRRSRNTRLVCKFIFAISSADIELFGLVPRLIGREGRNMKSIWQHSGCKVRIRGIGSHCLEGPQRKEAKVPLQIVLSADDADSLAHGRRLVTELLRDVGNRLATQWQVTHGGKPPLLYVVVDRAN